MPSPDHALGANLPPPIDGEPDDLRRDILDELEDHLDCAMRRELTHHDHDEDAARRAVLDRFGDPRAVARRLLLDAMKERLMSHRITVAANIVMAAACVTLCVLVWSALRQSNAMTRTLLTQLSEREQAIPMEWSRARVDVRRADGTPLAATEVALSGQAYGEESLMVEAFTDERGEAVVGPVRPGRYFLVVTDERVGRVRHTREVMLEPGREKHVTVEWPAPKTKTREVAFDLEIPDGRYVLLHLEPSVEHVVDESRWWSGPRLAVLVGSRGAALLDPSAPRPSAVIPAEHVFTAPIAIPFGGMDLTSGEVRPGSCHVWIDAVYAPDVSVVPRNIQRSFQVEPDDLEGPWRITPSPGAVNLVTRLLG